MALLKTQEEIQKMREGGKILSEALAAAVSLVEPGVNIRDLDKRAEEVLRGHDAEPSFLNYKSSKLDPPFPSTVCISINDEIVHGCGNRDITLEEGDIVGMDIGCWYKGLCTDMAVTVPVGKVSDEALELMLVTKESCLAAVKNLKHGGTIADVGRAVEGVVKPHGYGIVHSLVGHGVGHGVHEDPRVPNFYDKRSEKIEVKSGMCLAIEPMITLGDYNLTTKSDGWSMATVDGSLGAHFEVTVVINKDGAEILTPLPV